MSKGSSNWGENVGSIRCSSSPYNMVMVGVSLIPKGPCSRKRNSHLDVHVRVQHAKLMDHQILPKRCHSDAGG